MLLAAALKGRHLFPRCVYILGGVVMVFFGGEEINWGQRIIRFETPAFLANLNTQENSTFTTSVTTSVNMTRISSSRASNGNYYSRSE